MADEEVEVQGRTVRLPPDVREAALVEGFYVKTEAGDWVRQSREAPSPFRHRADISNPWGCDE